LKGTTIEESRRNACNGITGKKQQQSKKKKKNS